MVDKLQLFIPGYFIDFFSKVSKVGCLFKENNSTIFFGSDKILAFKIEVLEDMYAAAKSLQLCPTLCDPHRRQPPGSPVPGILHARTLEWVAISFSNAGKWKVKVKSLSRVGLFATPWTAAYQAPPSMGFSRQSTGVGCHCLLQKNMYTPLVFWELCNRYRLFELDGW